MERKPNESQAKSRASLARGPACGGLSWGSGHDETDEAVSRSRSVGLQLSNLGDFVAFEDESHSFVVVVPSLHRLAVDHIVWSAIDARNGVLHRIQPAPFGDVLGEVAIFCDVDH